MYLAKLRLLGDQLGENAAGSLHNTLPLAIVVSIHFSYTGLVAADFRSL